MRKEVWDVLINVGILVGIIGCFMPWFENVYRMCGNAPPFVSGAGFLPGFLTFLGLLSMAVSLRVFMVKRKVYMIFVALTSGLIALLISGSWILNPVGLAYFGTVAYTPLYGAYVTVLSVLIVSEMVFLHIVTTAEKQLNLRKSKQWNTL